VVNGDGPHQHKMSMHCMSHLKKAGKLSIGGNVLSDEYLAWNTAITEAIYNTSANGVPVYLDLDDDKFAEIASHPSLKKFDSSKAGLSFSVERFDGRGKKSLKFSRSDTDAIGNLNYWPKGFFDDSMEDRLILSSIQFLASQE